MGNLLRYDSPAAKWILRACDLLLLNALTLLCCLPVFTIGASLSAMQYVVLRLVRGEESGIARDFFHAFRSHFAQSVGLTAVYLLSGGAILMGLYLFNHVDMGNLDGWRYILYLALLVHFVLFTYVFPVFARYDNTIKNTLKNAYLLAARYPVNSVVAAITNGLPWIVCLAWPLVFQRLFVLWLLFGLAVPGYWTAGNFRRIFDQLEAQEMPKTEEMVSFH